MNYEVEYRIGNGPWVSFGFFEKLRAEHPFTAPLSDNCRFRRRSINPFGWHSQWMYSDQCPILAHEAA